VQLAIAGSPRFKVVLPTRRELRQTSGSPGSASCQLPQDFGHPGAAEATLRWAAGVLLSFKDLLISII